MVLFILLLVVFFLVLFNCNSSVSDMFWNDISVNADYLSLFLFCKSDDN